MKMLITSTGVAINVEKIAVVYPDRHYVSASLQVHPEADTELVYQANSATDAAFVTRWLATVFATRLDPVVDLTLEGAAYHELRAELEKYHKTLLYNVLSTEKEGV